MDGDAAVGRNVVVDVPVFLVVFEGAVSDVGTIEGVNGVGSVIPFGLVIG